MLDILLNSNGDYKISDTGDIVLTQSVRQAIRIRLKWFFGEWRLGPLLGLDYWGTVLVKNPNLVKVRQAIRDEILSVEEVTAVNRVDLKADAARRQLIVSFEAATSEETFQEEVKIHV